jgi:hypothetical protein
MREGVLAGNGGRLPERAAPGCPQRGRQIAAFATTEATAREAAAHALGFELPRPGRAAVRGSRVAVGVEAGRWLVQASARDGLALDIPTSYELVLPRSLARGLWQELVRVGGRFGLGIEDAVEA